MKYLIFLLLLAGSVVGACVEPGDGMIIRESVTFCTRTYDVPNGILVSADNIVVDCNTAVLRGISGQSNIGLYVENVKGVTIRNCNILTFDQGIYLKNVTNSIIEENAVLKNRIGIRMLDSYENIIRENSDKSFQLAVSAINSKYNIVMLGNKNVERAFCEVNACNQYRDMNPCEAGDFYCSSKCSPETDADCAPPVPVVEDKPEIKSVEQIEAEARKEVEELQKPVEEPKIVEKKSLSIWTKIFIYAIFYALAFVVIRAKRRG